MAPSPSRGRLARRIRFALGAAMRRRGTRDAERAAMVHTRRSSWLKDPFLTARLVRCWVAVILAAVVHRPRCDAARVAAQGSVVRVYRRRARECVVAANVASPRLGFASYLLLATLGQLVAEPHRRRARIPHPAEAATTPWRRGALRFYAPCSRRTPNSSDLTWYEGLKLATLAQGGRQIFPVQACVNAVMAQHLTAALAELSSRSPAASSWQVDPRRRQCRRARGLVLDGGASEWWLWFGGLCGAYIVSANCAAVPIVGRRRTRPSSSRRSWRRKSLFDAIGAFNFTPLASHAAWRAVGAVLSVGCAAAYTLGAPPRKWLCWCCDRRGRT